jgi:hypothetical protein
MPRAVAVGGTLNRESFLAQAADHEIRNRRFVLDYQNPDTHAMTLAKHSKVFVSER